MFRLEVLPARYGDCLWIEYGDEGHPYRVLIDGGAPGVYKRALKPRIQKVPDNERNFELLVVTHVDYDHIRGIIELALDEKTPYAAKDVWFNGWRHLPSDDPSLLAGKHGEQLTDLLLSNGDNWNQTGFDGKAVVVPDDAPHPQIPLDGGAVLTLLAPTVLTLRDLRKDWRKSTEDINITPEELEEKRKEGKFKLLGKKKTPDVPSLLAAEFEEDDSAANGSSIAFLLEYGQLRLLFAGDAHPSTLVETIGRLGDGRLKIGACKLPHHGSRGSVSTDLIKALDCPAYIFSSNGDQFEHPHPEAVARVIAHGGEEPELIFNYRTDETKIWDDEGLRKRHGYRVSYPDSDTGGVTLEWELDE